MSFKVSYKFLATDGFTRVAKKIARSVDSVGKKMNSFNKKMAASFRKSRKEGESAASAIKGQFGQMAAAAAGFFGAKHFIQTGARFQDAIADLSAITGAGGEQLAKYQEEILGIAKASSIAQDQVAIAFTEIASSKSELLETEGALAAVTEQALLLANAAGIEVTDAIRASVGSLNQFGKGSDQAGRFVNVLAAGAKVGASQVGETAEALKNVGAISASFNTSFETTNALIQGLAKGGLKGAEAGTSLKGVFSRLVTEAEGSLNPSLHGIIGSLEKLKVAGLSSAEMFEFFGADAATAGIILLDNLDTVKKWEKGITGTNIAQEQATIRLGTFNAKMRKLGVTVNDSLIKMFIRLEPTITKMAKGFTKWVDSIDNDEIKAMGDNLAVIADAVGLITKAVGALIDGLKIAGSILGQTAAAIASLDFSHFTLGGLVGDGKKVVVHGVNNMIETAPMIFDAMTRPSPALGAGMGALLSPTPASAPAGGPMGGAGMIDVNVKVEGDGIKTSQVNTKRSGSGVGKLTVRNNAEFTA